MTFRTDPTGPRVQFWLGELRTPALLLEAAERFGEQARSQAVRRPLLEAALAGREDEVAQALAREEAAERAADRAYWAPLRAELGTLRRETRGGAQDDG